MKLLKTILVAVDFDSSSRHVLAESAKLAKHFGSKVVLLHVIESPDRTADEPESLEAAIRSRLEEMHSELPQGGVSASQILCPRGKAPIEIVAAAENVDANLIMLGARASAAAGQFALGTTTEKVMRKSAKLEENIASIEAAYREGRELLAQGLHEAALVRFNQCLQVNPYFVQAIEAKALAHERLGHRDQTDLLRKQAAAIRDRLWVIESI